MKETQEQLRVSTEKKAYLTKALPVWERITQLQDHEIPQLQARIKTLSEEVKPLKLDKERVHQERKGEVEWLSKYQRIQEKGVRLTQHQKEMDALKEEVESLQSLLQVSEEAELNKVMERLRERLTEAKDQREAQVRKKRELEADGRRVLQESSEVERKVRQGEGKVERLYSLGSERKRKLQALSDAQDQCKTLHIKLTEQESNLSSQQYDTRIQAMEEKVLEIRTEGGRKLKEHREYLSRVKGWTSNLEAFLHLTESLQDAREELSQVEEQVRSQTQKLKVIETSITQDEEEKRVLEEEKAGFIERERSIKGTLRWRELAKQLEKAKEHYHQAMGAMDKTDKAAYQREMEELHGRKEQLMTERAGSLGEIKQLEAHVTRLKLMLEGEYRDVDGKYRRHLIKLRVCWGGG